MAYMKTQATQQAVNKHSLGKRLLKMKYIVETLWFDSFKTCLDKEG